VRCAIHMCSDDYFFISSRALLADETSPNDFSFRRTSIWFDWNLIFCLFSRLLARVKVVFAVARLCSALKLGLRLLDWWQESARKKVMLINSASGKISLSRQGAAQTTSIDSISVVWRRHHSLFFSAIRDNMISSWSLLSLFSSCNIKLME
jgi:hypothetical protein